MIYTSYFANMKNIPSDVVPIAICGKAPDGYKGLQYKKLAPMLGFFLVWQRNHDNAYYTKRYHEEVIDQLDIREVLLDLHKMSGGKDMVLLCYEKPGDFCHRHIVRAWLKSNGILSEEFGQ